MIERLSALTLAGSLAFLVVWAIDAGMGKKMQATWRRRWWLLVSLVFLLPLRLPVLPVATPPALSASQAIPEAPQRSSQAATGSSQAPLPRPAAISWLAILWGGGAAGYLWIVAIQTVRVGRRWGRERFSDDHALRDLLEDCKQEAGITAPIGLVVSTHLAAPALLGWLRPRILLPASLAGSLHRDQLRPLLLHELAHFNSLDIPMNWLFTVVRAIHWFNPLAHMAALAWGRFREEAADETALRWMKEPNGHRYGETLLLALREAGRTATPFGALSLGESVQNLKRRIIMLNYHPTKSIHTTLGITVALLVLSGAVVRPARAEEKKNTATVSEKDAKEAAVAAMEAWMKGIDAGHYPASWNSASKVFQGAISSSQWTDALNKVRVPLGTLRERKLASALYQNDVPNSSGKPLKGEFVIAQFESSFENLNSAMETVTFQKEGDGVWRAAGYFIKPR